MKYKYLILAVAVSVCGISAAQEPKGPEQLSTLDPQRVSQIENILTQAPKGYAVPISNRKVWDKLACNPDNAKVVSTAVKICKDPMPAWDSSLILDYAKTGIRDKADKMMGKRSSLLQPLVIAECLEDKGRFIPMIEKVLTELCTQPTWVLVAHDVNLDNFYGRAYHVDLNAASTADMVGQAIYMVGDKLSPATKKLVEEALQKRIFQPALKTIRTLDGMGAKHFWYTRVNNWNMVCLCGTTNCALAILKDKKEKAEFVAAAEKYIQNGIASFADDGYCPEGIGYYNYGFSAFVRLREGIYRATNGKLDLFDNPKIKNIALFGPHSEIINGVYPAISDCRVNTAPSDWIFWYCCRAYKWKDDTKIDTSSFSDNPSLTNDLITIFSDSPCKKVVKELNNENPLRFYFERADILTCRPQKKDCGNSLAICLKGGNNCESHNHNDVGSYTIVAGKEIMMGDMGGPTAYTSKTFTNERYSLYRTFASYGHPVPLYDSIQQYESAQARAKILSKSFTDDKDLISYDITSAYSCDKLTKAIRTFEYERNEGGCVKVRDEFSAKEPISFETAVTTRQKVEVKDNIIYLIGKDCTIEIAISAPVAFNIRQETIADYAMVPFTRIGISLNQKIKEGEIIFTYKKR